MALQQTAFSAIRKVVWVKKEGGVFFFMMNFALSQSGAPPATPAAVISAMPYSGSWEVFGNVLERVPGEDEVDPGDPVTKEMRTALYQWTPKAAWDKQEVEAPGASGELYYVWMYSPGAVGQQAYTMPPPTDENFTTPAGEAYPDIFGGGPIAELPLWSVFGQWAGNGGLIREYSSIMTSYGIPIPPEWPAGSFTSFENASLWASAMNAQAVIGHGIAAGTPFFQEHPEQLAPPTVWTPLVHTGSESAAIYAHSGRALFEISADALKKAIKDSADPDKFTFKITVAGYPSSVVGSYSLTGWGYKAAVRSTFPVDDKNEPTFDGSPDGDNITNSQITAGNIYTITCDVKEFTVSIVRDVPGGGGIG